VEIEATPEEEFDRQRAILAGRAMFPPFRVQRTRPLAQALRSGLIPADHRLLVVPLQRGVVTLDPAQMTFHHVAQGALAAEPWLVAF